MGPRGERQGIRRTPRMSGIGSAPSNPGPRTKLPDQTPGVQGDVPAKLAPRSRPGPTWSILLDRSGEWLMAALQGAGGQETAAPDSAVGVPPSGGIRRVPGPPEGGTPAGDGSRTA